MPEQLLAHGCWAVYLGRNALAIFACAIQVGTNCTSYHGPMLHRHGTEIVYFTMLPTSSAARG